MSKSENKKSAPPKTSVASEAGNATGQNAQHTPGPWTACFPTVDGVRHYFPHVHFGTCEKDGVHCSNYVTINEAGAANTGGLAPFDANARLIAAAPELADELQKTTIFLETVARSVFASMPQDSPQRTFLEGHIELNRAAIAKAEGRA